jgi:hypothetical protein
MNSLAALALALLALGCGRVPLDSPALGGPVGAADGGDLGAGAGASGRVPDLHRAASVACPIAEPMGLPCIAPGACSTDAECQAGQNGRCVASHVVVSCECVYDTCYRDGDCPVGQACACKPFEFGNACVPASCRVDTDCGPGGFCGPVIEYCARTTVGFQCHSFRDGCFGDADCPITDTCDAYAGEPWGCRIPIVCR